MMADRNKNADIVDDLHDWAHIVRASVSSGAAIVMLDGALYDDAIAEIEQLRAEVWRLTRMYDDERNLADRLAGELRSHAADIAPCDRYDRTVSAWSEARGL